MKITKLILTIFILISCSKPIKVFEVKSDVENVTFEFFKNNTFKKKVVHIEDTHHYSGNWSGSLLNDSIFTTVTTNKGSDIITHTYTNDYKVVNNHPLEIKKILTNKFKLEFLNEILSDTVNLKLIESNKVLISNIPLMTPLSTIEVNGDASDITKLTFSKSSNSKKITQNMKMMDTLFVQNQLADNKRLDLSDLTKFGYNIFNYKYYYENNISPFKKVEEENLKNGLNSYTGLFFIDKPVFNKKLNKAFVRVQYGSSSGYVYIISKINGKWSEKQELYSWVY